ncbi:MAG: xanthine dehydrogenase family protein subunit M [Rhizobiaceae bacterium]
MRRFAYHEPTTLAAASALKKELGDEAFFFAGGTDLLVEIRERLRTVRHVINIKKIPNLDGFSYDDSDGLRFGALTTARELETSAEVRRHYPNFAAALSELGSIQVRNRATVIGNICRASPSADTIPPLIADEAAIEIYNPDGNRTVPLAEFFTGPGRTVLSPGEIAVGLSVPAPRPDSARAYIKHGRRKAMELATVGVAVSLDRDGGRCSDIRVALGAVGPTVLRASEAEALLKGSDLSPDAIGAAAAKAMQECTPISNVRSSADYRRRMVGVLTERAILQALEQTA